MKWGTQKERIPNRRFIFEPNKAVFMERLKDGKSLEGGNKSRKSFTKLTGERNDSKSRMAVNANKKKKSNESSWVICAFINLLDKGDRKMRY